MAGRGGCRLQTCAGLGAIHGFASVIGGYFRIPQGVVCGSLFAPTVKMTIENLDREGDNFFALEKFAKTGFLLSGVEGQDIGTGCGLLVDTLYKWTDDLEIQKLGHYGIEAFHLDMIVAETGQKNNPAKLTDQQLKAILTERLKHLKSNAAKKIKLSPG